MPTVVRTPTLAAPTSEDDAYLKILKEKGLDHERLYLDKLKAGGRVVVEIAPDHSIQTMADRTRQAMRDGADVIYQGALTAPGWFGDQTTNGRGWIAIGLVIFAQWSPIRAAFGALLFGAIPAWIAMRVGAQWIASKEGLDDLDKPPAWVERWIQRPASPSLVRR